MKSRVYPSAKFYLDHRSLACRVNHISLLDAATGRPPPAEPLVERAPKRALPKIVQCCRPEAAMDATTGPRSC
ncbi:MAG: hypothetical protein ACRECN_00925 [Methylocella sp.]